MNVRPAAIVPRFTMRKIPLNLLQAILADPYYKVCVRHKERRCRGRITLEHAIIYAGTQLNEKWAILPVCAYHHAVDEFQDRGDLDKEYHHWVALNRATPDELLRISKAINYKNKLNFLNSIYGHNFKD